jgi:hypothetical protein
MRNYWRKQYLLGHKSIMNTERYTHLANFDSMQYFSATARNVDEAQKLAEDGWSYFCESEGTKIFRKPK